MKIAAIIGSPKGTEGNTGTIVKAVLEAAEEAGVETEIYSLGKYIVEACNGCHEICHASGKCHKDDDLEEVKQAMILADGIIFASPVYNFNVSAQMKALIDRSGLLLHCRSLAGKYGAIVTSVGGSDPDDVITYLNRIFKSHGIWNTGSLGAVALQLSDPEEKDLLLESARSLGKNLVDDIKNRKKFPEQEEEHNDSKDIMRIILSMNEDKWPFVKDHWVKNIGLE